MITNNYTPYSGGVVSSIQALSAELRSLGHHVIIVTFAFEPHSSREVDVERISCITRFRYKNNIIPLPIRIKAQMRDVIERYAPDVIHVHHPFGLGAAALPLAQAYRLPIVFTHHTLYAEYAHYIPLPSRFLKPIIQRKVVDFCAAVDRVIVPTPSVKLYLQQQGFGGSMSVIASGLLPLFMQSGWTAKEPIAGRAIRLLTVSRFVPEKNIEWLLRMFSLLQRSYPFLFELKLVGYGALLPYLQYYAYTHLQLPVESVQFLERPSKERLLEAYQNADIFVFASQSETQGLVIAEAFSQATPVVALAGPGVSDGIQEGCNGFLVHTQEEMIERLYYLRGHASRLSEFQRAAYQEAQRYHPTCVAQQIESLYVNVLAA